MRLIHLFLCVYCSTVQGTSPPVVVIPPPPVHSACINCQLVRVACTDELREERCPRQCGRNEECCDNCCGGQSCVAREDDVCSLPLDPGPCYALFRRWGYKDGGCQKFVYGGCGGNGNRFQTRRECQNMCGDSCSFRCGRKKAPLCGTDGVTYRNRCELKKAICENPSLSVEHKGECDDVDDTCDGPPICITLYQPICGSNGVTYGNECEFNYAKLCEDSSLTIDYYQECGDAVCLSRICPLYYNPVCGSDGKTYSNPCFFNVANRCDNPTLTYCEVPVCPDGFEVVAQEGSCCGNECRKTEEEKEGVCPPASRRHCIKGGPDDIPGCESDSDCKGTQKCCPDVCRSICKDPELRLRNIDCSLVRCANPDCPEGFEQFTPTGQCCPRCRRKKLERRQRNIDCSLIRCANPDCPEGLEQFTPTGQCCPRCRRKKLEPPVVDCSLVLCALPDCLEGQETYTPEGECCPECRPRNVPICMQREDVGPCDGAFPRWRYNIETCQCEEFTYGGCEGNENNFETEKECSEECGGEGIFNCLVSPCLFATCPRYPNARCVENYCGGCNAHWYVDDERVTCDVPICMQPEDAGPCRGAFPRWRYNIETCQCEEFTYGGCEGNDNNFETEKECSEECGGEGIFNCFVSPCQFATCPRYPNARCVENYCGGCNAHWYVDDERVTCDVCTLPLEVGPCEALIPRWGFGDGECVEFIYGGCEGNENNFESQAACEAACESDFY